MKQINIPVSKKNKKKRVSPNNGKVLNRNNNSLVIKIKLYIFLEFEEI